MDLFINTFHHELIENTILDPKDGLRTVVWKAPSDLGGQYHRIDFFKVVRDEYEQV